eukprot:2619479-Rhodomonas_salina.4
MTKSIQASITGSSIAARQYQRAHSYRAGACHALPVPELLWCDPYRGPREYEGRTRVNGA